MKQKITFIVNPHSGVNHEARRFQQLVNQRLDKWKYEPTIQWTEDVGHAIFLSQQAKENGAEVVVAVGGDGTLNEVATSLVGSETVFGALPSGSGNGFTMAMGIGRDMKKAINILNQGKVKTIDAMSLNDQTFINLSGVGFASRVAYKFKESEDRGFLNYLKISLEESVAVECENYQVSIDGKPYQSHECLMIEVANSSSFGYHFQLAPLAKVDDGLIELVLIHKRPKWKYFLEAPRMVAGSIHKADFTERISCQEVKIKIPENSFIHLDGEGFMASEELHYKVLPKALKVIVP